MKTTKLLSLVTLLAVIFMAMACSTTTQPQTTSNNTQSTATVEVIKWKMALFGGPPPGAAANTSCAWFADEVEKRSNGRIKIERFYNESLAKVNDQPDGLKSGLFQITSISPANYPTKFPLFTLAYLPSIFPFTELTPAVSLQFHQIMGEYCNTPALVAEYSKWGALRVGMANNDFYRLMGNVKISNIEQFKGVKIRALGGLGDLCKATGAVPVVTTISEMYDALSKGTVDMVTHAPDAFVEFKIYEASKYFTDNLALGAQALDLAIRIEDYQKLPKDLQDVIMSVSKDMPKAQTDIKDKFQTQALETIRNSKKVEFVKFSDTDMTKLRDLAPEIWKTQVNTYEKSSVPARDSFNSLQNIIKKYIPTYVPNPQ